MKRTLLGVASLVAVMTFLTGPAAGKEGEMVIESGRNVTFDYTLTVDGKVVDTSKNHGPFQYKHGEKNIIPGLSNISMVKKTLSRVFPNSLKDCMWETKRALWSLQRMPTARLIRRPFKKSKGPAFPRKLICMSAHSFKPQVPMER